MRPQRPSKTDQDVYVYIVSPSFNPDYSWRVSFGPDDSFFFAKIRDDGFIRKVAEGETFSTGETLYVKLVTIQSVEDGKIKTEREIRKVYKHNRNDEQDSFDF